MATYQDTPPSERTARSVNKKDAVNLGPEFRLLHATDIGPMQPDVSSRSHNSQIGSMYSICEKVRYLLARYG